MNTAKFRDSIDQLYHRLISLTETKGEEYKRREDNQFANFERGAAALGLTREQVLMVYLSKHLDSIVTFIKDSAKGEARAYAEPITGRIDDAILYLLLLRGMVGPIEDLAFSQEFVGRVTAPSAEPGPDQIGADHTFRGEPIGDTVEMGRLSDPGVEALRAPDLYISPQWDLAVKACALAGKSASVHALGAIDQLFGIPREKVVGFIFTGHDDRDEPMLNELNLRAGAGKFVLQRYYFNNNFGGDMLVAVP